MEMPESERLEKSPGMNAGVGESFLKSQQEYEDRGEKRIADYNDKLAGNDEDVEIMERLALPEDVEKWKQKKAFAKVFDNDMYKSLYDVESEDKDLDKDYKLMIEAFEGKLDGFDTSTIKEGRYVALKNKMGDGNVIQDAAYAKDGKFMIAMNAFKEEDPMQQPENENNLYRVPVNEMFFQGLQYGTKDDEHPDGITDKLKVVFLDDIQNIGFWSIVEKIYEKNKKPLGEVTVWKEGSDEFKRLVGSDNINGKLIAFGNHKNAMGSKKIKQIVIAPKQAVGNKDEQNVPLYGAIVFE